MKWFSYLPHLLLIHVLCSCTSLQHVTSSEPGELILKKSNKNSVSYHYHVPEWMAWAQVEELVLEMTQQSKILSVDRLDKNKNTLVIATRGLIDPFSMNEMLERELAYLPGPHYLKKRLSESDFKAMNLEELRYINEHPELFEFEAETD